MGYKVFPKIVGGDGSRNYRIAISTNQYRKPKCAKCEKIYTVVMFDGSKVGIHKESLEESITDMCEPCYVKMAIARHEELGIFVKTLKKLLPFIKQLEQRNPLALLEIEDE